MLYCLAKGGLSPLPDCTLCIAVFVKRQRVASLVMVNMGSVDFSLEQNVEKILNGEGMEVTGIDSAPEHIKPVTLRKTVCYIVSAVIFNSKVSSLWMVLHICCGDDPKRRSLYFFQLSNVVQVSNVINSGWIT